MSCSMYVILPQPGPAPDPARTPRRRITFKSHATPATGWPVLWLLHGLSDDHSIWLRRTSIERYVATLPLAVVMPAVHRSFYTDMAQGLPYWTFISEELPRIVRSFFPISARRRDNFVAGLSMGGYGAFKLALSHPDRFAAAASLSGALDVVEICSNPHPNRAEFLRIFGPPKRLARSSNDLFDLARRLARRRGPKPRLFQCCGQADFLYAMNLRFRDHALALGLDLTYEEHPTFGHDWAYWDLMIQRVLSWLPLPRPLLSTS